MDAAIAAADPFPKEEIWWSLSSRPTVEPSKVNESCRDRWQRPARAAASLLFWRHTWVTARNAAGCMLSRQCRRPPTISNSPARIIFYHHKPAGNRPATVILLFPYGKDGKNPQGSVASAKINCRMEGVMAIFLERGAAKTPSADKPHVS